jgi:hypothetical protein
MTRDYKKEYANYQGTPIQKKHRAERNAARRLLEREGLVHKGDGKDVDHRKPLDSGGSNARSNLRVQSKSKNRGFARDSKNQPK